MNKSCIHRKNTDISGFQNGLNYAFSLTGFFVICKIVEGSHKMKKCHFLTSGLVF